MQILIAENIKMTLKRYSIIEKMKQLKRVIYTDIINSISKIVIIKPTVLVLVRRVVGFKSYIETKHKEAKIVS